MPVPEKRNFQKLNTDLELRLMQQGMYRYLLNGVVGASDADNLGSVENAVGNRLINNQNIENATCVGSVNDKETNTLIIFISSTSQDDSIWRYDPADESFTQILSWSGFNFDRITGAGVLDGHVIWTDDSNEIRRVDIDKAINGRYAGDSIQFTIDSTGQDILGGLYFIINELNILGYFPTDKTFDVAFTTGSQPSGTYTVKFSTVIGGKTLVYVNEAYVGPGSGTATVNLFFGILEEDITLLRRAPVYPLSISKSEDETVQQNNLYKNSFQFTYRYVYWDNERSVVAPMSRMGYIDNRDELSEANNNRIRCVIPAIEDIRYTVKAIEWIFRVDNTNEFAVFKVTPSNIRNVDFLNDVAGATLPEAEVLLPFHDVPRQAKGLRITQNRVWLNNYLTSYDYQNIEMAASVVDPGDATRFTDQTLYRREIRKTFFYIGFTPPDPPFESTYEYYWWKDPNGRWFRVTMFYNNIFDPTGTLPNICSVDPGQGDGLTDTDLATVSYYDSDLNEITEFFPEQVSKKSDVIKQPKEATIAFKAGDTYQVGVRFSDGLGRHIGVFTNNNDARVTMPLGDPANIATAASEIQWNLPTDGAGIPEWATHYEIMRTRNLNRSFFLQGFAALFVYGIREDKNDGSSELKLSLDWSSDAKLYFHVKNSQKYKIGYVYSEGDRIRFYYGQWWDAKIDSQDGPWIVADNVVPRTTFLPGTISGLHYEIYTPYLGSLDESFFEVGEKYAITNPGQSNRNYSVNEGVLIGDVHRKKRNIHLTDSSNFRLSPEDERKIFLQADPVLKDFEAMNPNDDYYDQWVSDIGRASPVITEAEARRKLFTLKYGGLYDIDSLDNQIGKFNPFDEYNMPLENGPAVSLAITGNNLIYFHEQEASSVYINEGFLSTQDGESNLIRSVDTVGDDRKLRYGHGCVNPESVAEYADKVFYWDLFKGAVVRYSNEGLVALSDDGMVNYFYQLSRRLLPYKDSSKVYGIYDPYLDYYILSFAPVTEANYAGETFAFSERTGGAVGWFSYMPENFATINKTLLSFQSGQLWVHDDENNCKNFYGVQYDRIIRFVGNQDGLKNKIWANFRIDAESMLAPETPVGGGPGNPDYLNTVVIKITNDRGQEGRVYGHQILEREGVFIGPFRQDVLTPNSKGISFPGGQAEQEIYFMYNGDVIRSQVCEVEITNDRTDLSPLYFVTLLYRISEASFN